MKKFFTSIFLLGFLAYAGISQDGKDHFKQAEKSMKDFIKNPDQNLASYQDALSSFNAAFKDDEIASDPSNWIKKGEYYTEVSDFQIKTRLLNPEYTMIEPNAGVIAYEAFTKALAISTKKGDTKKAIEGISDAEGHISNTGVELYREKKYAEAFQNFDASLKAKALLNENGEASRLDDAAMYNDQVFFTAVSAYFGGLKEKALPYLKQILEMEETLDDASHSNKPFAYEAIYKTYDELGKVEEGLPYLNEGRKMFPEDSGLLFAEINYYLETGQNDILIEKLNTAKELEPDNLSVLNTLGNVYEKMSMSARETGNAEQAEKYFEEARMNYKDVLDTAPDNFMASYSIGALYYNKAASMTEMINELANDFSPEGTKKYDTMKKEMDGYFEEALPYFLKAESVQKDDLNTLIALREIYARKNDFEKVNQYKEKFEMASAKAEN